VSGFEAPAGTVVDVAFPLAGTQLPREHALPLARALVAQLPWLAEEPLAGVHAVKTVPGGGSVGLLSRRARMLIRVPGQRRDALAALAGCVLDVGGCEVRLGAPVARALLPHSTLFARFVDAEGADEVGFMQGVARALQAAGIDARTVCGRRSQVGTPGGPVAGFALMLHGLSPADSLRAQSLGVGPHRLLGCGLFVPHRSAAAVGA
jgi:CRISPR-associated protein Cas6